MKNIEKKKITIKCPFHEENTPSCVIDLDRNMFHCFGCGKEGKVKLSSPASKHAVMQKVLYDGNSYYLKFEVKND
jgi:hypothetical protein